ncbi:MAG: glycosyltransferase [Planctomycetaceae bacterium]|nr:glycosyltransferase [Planctomycetaceae bacterium]
MAGICAVVLLVIALVAKPNATLLAINVAVQIMYFLFTIAKVYILSRGLSRRDHLRYSASDVAAISDKELPIYTLLIPVYKEGEVITKLIERLLRLDYPQHKLDIRILLESDDLETRAALEGMALPSCVTLLNIPDTQPHTKPKACNYGLLRARGEYVVIYDAEDIPETDQLKKAYLAFRDTPDNYVCIQSKLNYFNSDQNLLTRWFTQEYSTWFDVLLIGTMSVDVPIPLGGTSNHFKVNFLKQIGAWDPFNVTEDADLGIRLYKMEYKTAVLDSHTWEEANSKVGNWIRQRSRWIKGYMQTWLVHMRRPFHLYRELGFKGLLGYNAMVLGTPLLPLLNPLFWLLMIVWLVASPGYLDALFPGWLYYIALFQLLVGNFVFVYSNIYGSYCVIRDSEVSGAMRLNYSIIMSGLLLPFYWVLMSIAGYKALIQLFTRPHYWEKTTHGLTEQTEVKTVRAEDHAGKPAAK